MKKTVRQWIKFSFKGEPKQEVYIAGTFNDWNPSELKLRETKKGIMTASRQSGEIGV